MKTPRSKTAPTTLTAKEKQITALEMRKAGATFEKIATAVGCGTTQAHRYVTQALRELAEKISETAQELRSLEAQRLDALLLGLWGKATKGDHAAVNAALRIMERRARLFGLDTLPQPPEPSEPTAITVRFEDPELARIETGYYDAAPAPTQAEENARHTEFIAGLEMVVDRWER